MSRDDELTLIEKARGGDAGAFEKLVLCHEKLVYNLALRTLGNEQDAQDAAQEAFIKAWTGLESFRGDSKFSVWLYRLTHNVCMDAQRRRKEAAISLSMENDEGEEGEIELPDERWSPQQVLERREQQQYIRQAMEALPEEYRRVLLLRESADLSYEEIARVLGVDMGTVKSRIFRARKKLCKILSENGNFFTKKSSDNRKGGVQA